MAENDQERKQREADEAWKKAQKDMARHDAEFEKKNGKR
jgi:hypothetical protein